ncbi:MAG: hypothetical protein EXR75_11415 [Myxococcales bacterium]|nr:hypothetical protein [Myxococcales bacterium]
MPPSNSRPSNPRPSRLGLLRLGALWLALAAPTAGDIGSCGRAREDLDAGKFFAEKSAIDCANCIQCNIATSVCDAACDPAETASAFADGCYPLVHDGEVCLAALSHASCDDYQSYMAELGATAPTECNFCPPERRPTSEGP